MWSAALKARQGHRSAATAGPCLYRSTRSRHTIWPAGRDETLRPIAGPTRPAAGIQAAGLFFVLWMPRQSITRQLRLFAKRALRPTHGLQRLVGLSDLLET
jgi:hypothetical protein